MLETLKLRANLVESSCLIFANYFLPCMIIVSFHACGLRWSIRFLQSRWGSWGWQFLFPSRGVSHGRKGGATLKKSHTKKHFKRSLFTRLNILPPPGGSHQQRMNAEMMARRDIAANKWRLPTTSWTSPLMKFLTPMECICHWNYPQSNDFNKHWNYTSWMRKGECACLSWACTV